MNRLPLALAACLALLVAAAPALAAPSVSGTLRPGPSGYAYFISTEAIDAQNGPDVIIKGTIGQLPADAGYWVQVGLVPKAVRDQLLAGTITSLWDEGVYLVTEMDAYGQFSVTAEDYAGQAGAPARTGVANDGSIAFKLQLKPTLNRRGGSATLTVDKRRTNSGKETLAYGKRLAADPKNESYAAAYLVAQVLSSGATSGVQVSAKAVQLKDALRITKILTCDAQLNPTSTFSPGQPVTVQTRYKVLSTREKRLSYEVRGTVALLGSSQGYSDQKRTGKYAFNKSFLIPPGTSPGAYKIKVRLELVRHLTDHYTNEPYEEILYTEEAFQKITVQ